MQRISVVGCPGAGKSTFALELGRLLCREVTHLDRNFWTPDIHPLPHAQRKAVLERLLEQTPHIIEGGHPWTYARRLASCDTLIWLDIPLHWRLLNLLRRKWSGNGQLGFHATDAESRKRVPKLHGLERMARQQLGVVAKLEPVFAAPPAGKRLIRLRSRAEARAFLASLSK